VVEHRSGLGRERVVQKAHEKAGQRAETAVEFAALIADIEHSPTGSRAAAALSQVRHGVITGEGPTTQGRIHFSRTIDAGDTALIARILLAGNGAVSRAEAEALFDIHDAAFERTDNGRFDDLFAKAIAHHVMAATGHPVPSRAVALAPTTTLADWAAPCEVAVEGDIAWLETRLRRKARNCAPLAAIAAMTGFATSWWAASVAAAIDLAA
jgi:hypothetical protein